MPVFCESPFALPTFYLFTTDFPRNGLNIMPSYSTSLNLTGITKSLNTASSFLGWGFASFFMGPTVDRIGRRSGVLLSIIVKLIGVALMSGATGVPMFIVGRAILGAGAATSSIAASTLVLLLFSMKRVLIEVAG